MRSEHMYLLAPGSNVLTESILHQRINKLSLVCNVLTGVPSIYTDQTQSAEMSTHYIKIKLSKYCGACHTESFWIQIWNSEAFLFLVHNFQY